MRKTKLLLALAMVFAALFFGLNAKAQNVGEVPITLTYQGASYSSYRFEVFLFNNDIQEIYSLYTVDSRMDDPDTFRCGYVPAGNYSVYIRLSTGTEGRFNWSAKGQSGSNILLHENGNYYELLSNVDINDDWYNNDYGLNITMQNW